MLRDESRLAFSQVTDRGALPTLRNNSCVVTYMELHSSCTLWFEWDDANAKTNERKHGVRFDDAVLVFSDPCALVEQD